MKRLVAALLGETPLVSDLQSLTDEKGLMQTFELYEDYRAGRRGRRP